MSKRNIKLIDTNIIIRFLIGDSPVLSEKAKNIFLAVEADQMQVEIMESVFAETVFVLSKVYKVEREKISKLLGGILDLSGVKNRNIDVLKKALEIFCSHKVDIVDSLLCANENGYDGVLSFDKDIDRILKKDKCC